MKLDTKTVTALSSVLVMFGASVAAEIVHNPALVTDHLPARYLALFSIVINLLQAWLANRAHRVDAKGERIKGESDER